MTKVVLKMDAFALNTFFIISFYEDFVKPSIKKLLNTVSNAIRRTLFMCAIKQTKL